MSKINHFKPKKLLALSGKEYAGKNVLVTGGGTGLGKQIATFYSQLGLDVKRTLTNKKAARKRLLRQLASSALATENYSATAATSATSSTD